MILKALNICKSYSKKNVVNKETLTRYKNSGFALVYDTVLKKEKKHKFHLFFLKKLL